MVRKVSSTEAAAHAVVAEHVRAAATHRGAGAEASTPYSRACRLEQARTELSSAPLSRGESAAVASASARVRQPPPEHYTTARGLQPWDVVDAFGLDDDFYLASVLKYVLRAGRKGPKLDDLVKARNYLDEAVARERGRG